MTNKKPPALLLAAAGMELSWLMGTAFLILSLTGVSPLSLPQALAAFFVGAGLTLLMQKGSWRIIYRLGLQLLFFLMLLLHTLYSLSFGGELFWSTGWLETLLQGPVNIGQGMLWAAAFFVIVFFWGGGICLARRASSYAATTTRFDVGITAFILIFILVGVTDAPVMPVLLLLPPFFLTSMIGIALARNQKGDEQGAFQQKYRGNGPVLVFAVTVLLGGGAVILFLLPFLTLAAEAGYSAMVQYATPLSTLLGKIILFMFGYGRQMRRSAPAEDGGNSLLIDPEAVAGGDAGFWELLFSWASMGMMVAIGLVALSWGLWHLLRWLLSGTDESAKRRGIKELYLLFLQKWSSFWRHLHWWITGWLSCLNGGQRGGEASRFFRRLLMWGRWSGFDRFATETPREYGLVLIEHFPGAQAEIELIIHCFHDEVYGKKTLDRGQKQGLRRAWRRLCSPRRWPARLYKRLTQNISMESRYPGYKVLQSGIKEKSDKKANYRGDI